MAAAKYNSPEIDALYDELEELKSLQADIEEFIFMEETATKLAAKARDLARKYSDLRDVDRGVQDGLDDYHGHVLNALSAALDELDEAQDRRVERIDELREG